MGLYEKSLGGSPLHYPRTPTSDIGLQFKDVDPCSSDSELGDLVESGVIMDSHSNNT